MDVILASGEQTTPALLELTKTVPIVQPTLMDPVERGYVKSLARPGGNLTGLSLRVDPAISIPLGINFRRVRLIVAFAARNRLPVVGGTRTFPEEGGLISYGPNVSASFRQAASYVQKIFKGAKPADLPEQPTKFELVINSGLRKRGGTTR